MQMEHKFVVDVPRQKLWDFLMDVPRMATCIPGVESVEIVDANCYRGKLKVSVGPVSARFDGTVDILEMDVQQYHASLKASGADTRLGSGANVKMVMNLKDLAPTQSEMVVGTEVKILGKLGDFGQGVLNRKANDLMKEFSNRIKAALEV